MKKGFTLIETIIALVIFALASIGVGGAIVSVQQSWQKQKANVNLINSARWGMEFMANEIRKASVSSIAVITSPVDGIKLELPSGGSSYEVRYWRGDGGTYGETGIIYRGQGSGMGNANSARQELVNLIDGSNPIFSVSGNLVTIDFTVKKDSNSFRLKTAAGARNIISNPSYTKLLIHADEAPQAYSPQTYSTPGSYTYQVPSGVSSLKITLLGAKGGDAADYSSYGYPSGRGLGGNGGKVIATISVSPGEDLNIVVGGIGGTATAGNGGAGAGSPNGSSGSGNRGGGGGGGSSSVLRGSTALLVAGGGGGGGGGYYYTEGSFNKVFAGGNGGAGGGGAGGRGEGGYGGGGGGGGGSTIWGANGGSIAFVSGGCIEYAYTYDPGAYGIYMQGGASAVSGQAGGGGGAGGGYYGGGGGGPGSYVKELDSCSGGGRYGASGGGGGGGSNYIISGATDITNISGANTGGGSIIIEPIGGSSIVFLIDSSIQSHIITAVDNASTTITQSKFGGLSAAFDGSGDYLSLADSEDWALQGVFTIDTWIRFNATPGTIWILGQKPSNDQRWMFLYENPQLSFQVRKGGDTLINLMNTSWSPVNNQWYHLAVVADAGSWKLFVNGVQTASLTDSDIVEDMATDLYVGGVPGWGGYLNGYLDELRISKGIARWTENFPVPSAAYSPEE